MITIRPEIPGDRDAVRSVHVAAFEGPAEADLVERLRGHIDPGLSLVAEVEGAVVGHQLFSEVALEGAPCPRSVALAPLGVLPAYQRRGIGSALVHEGLAACRRLGYSVVVVVGDPAYYTRFGFATASLRGLRCAYDVPDEVFMVLELVPGGLGGGTGTVRYLPEFGDL